MGAVLAMHQSLTLPALAIRPRKHSIGSLHYVIAPANTVEVREIDEVRITPRRREVVYTLADGQKILVTKQNRLARPPEIDGILRLDDAGKSSWIAHRRLEEVEHMLAHGGWKALHTRIRESWQQAFRFRAETVDTNGVVIPGLRPPQLGALHAIGAHWSLRDDPATIVMPTGTGKTETMLGVLVTYVDGTLLVVVPSNVLREQTARKFMTLGLLRRLGNLADTALNPVVGVITRRPRRRDDLDLFEMCNVVVATMSALGQGTATQFGQDIAHRVSALIVDEAHHVAARTWLTFRDRFVGRKVLQFTATPFRRDGKLVDGHVIYNYPLGRAQQDGYFKPISFRPVFELDRDQGDRAIAEAAVAQLRKDLAEGYDHIILARCDGIPRSEQLNALYREIAPEFSPVIVHSDRPDAVDNLHRLERRDSRIVVCVDMLGEGFDLPALKIAALHDVHKSLAVLLQFTGRFSRTAPANIGDATVIANIANQDVSIALERLYSEDADWNILLSEYSSTAVKEHAELVNFLKASQRLDEGLDTDRHRRGVSHHLLRPKFSAAVYKAEEFRPRRFIHGLPTSTHVQRVWLHESSQTLYFVTTTEVPVPWTSSRELIDRQWDLFVLHYDREHRLLFLHSSDKESLHEPLAKAVGATELLRGNIVFRSLGNVNRLVFHNVGVRKHGRRNLRFALYTGADVAEALSISEKAGSVKSNLYGTGWENGRPVSIGCSYKGRVWSREQGTVPQFVTWCKRLATKLSDDSIDTTRIIDNVLIPEEVDRLPDAEVLGVEWPIELLAQSEERVTLYTREQELPLSLFSLEMTEVDRRAHRVVFRVRSDPIASTYVLKVGGPDGYTVSHIDGRRLNIRVGRLEVPLEQYLSDYPPLIRFLDLSELDGNLLVRPKDLRDLHFPRERFEVWDWAGTDITRESMWRGGEYRENSIQERVAREYREGGYDMIFDDDGAGEAADLVCMRDEPEAIRLALVHCKFSGGASGGKRINDVVEVCSQAVRSARWIWRFRDLCRHILTREQRLSRPHRATRFYEGQARDINRFLKSSRFKQIRAEVVVVQPGLSLKNHTPDQAAVLAAAHSFLKETVGVDLDVVCSA